MSSLILQALRRKFSKSIQTWIVVLIVLGLVPIGYFGWQDPIRQAEDPLYAIGLRLERRFPWLDVISIGYGEESSIVWVYIDMGSWYDDPAKYNLFAVSVMLHQELARATDLENIEYVSIGHMVWDPEKEKYAILQPWWFSGKSYLRYGRIYPAIAVTWWRAGYLAPDSYLYVGNPYRNPLRRLISYIPLPKQRAVAPEEESEDAER